MHNKSEPSFNAQIWVGLREAYSNKIHTVDEVRTICDTYVNTLDENGLGDCVSITPTEFRYTGGWEPGVIIGYINYPRFPSGCSKISKILALAELLKDGLGQLRVSVTTPKRTYLVENE